MPSLPTQPSIKIVKNIGRRGGAIDWSNRYFFTGSNPSGSTPWTTLADAVVAAEKAILPTTGVTILSAVGYDSGSDVPVFTKAYSVAGTYAPGGSEKRVPSDCAAMVKFTTDQRSTKNHPIYLFKWYHGVLCDESSGEEAMSTPMKAAYSTYAAAWIAGFSDGSATRHLCGPRGAVALTAIIPTYITHRDFPA